MGFLVPKSWRISGSKYIVISSYSRVILQLRILKSPTFFKKLILKSWRITRDLLENSSRFAFKKPASEVGFLKPRLARE